jgi:hypothetical protein
MARPGAKKYEEESEDEYEVERIESHKLVYKGKQVCLVLFIMIVSCSDIFRLFFGPF